MNEAGATASARAASPELRVAIAIKVEVSGIDLDGHEFMGHHAWTRFIGRSGAAIAIDRSLAPGQTLTIKRQGLALEAEVRVVGHLGNDSHWGDVYGIALMNRAGNFWGIDFLNEKNPEPLRMLLECLVCHTRQVTSLNELELAVVQRTERLSRSCPKCRDETLWQQVSYDDLSESATVATTLEQLSSGQIESAPASTKQPCRRKHRRVKTALKGCILSFGQETLIEVKDMSRSGIRFCCHRNFADGLLVRIAVPHTAGAANIFVSGRIRWSRVLAADMTECGLEYIND